jgi:hypothetical protein
MIVLDANIFGDCGEHPDSITQFFQHLSTHPWLREYSTAASRSVCVLPTLVNTVSRLRAGQSRDRKLPLIQSAQISFRAHLASCSMGAGALSPGAKRAGREADHSRLTLRLRIRGTNLRSSHVSKGRCLLTHNNCLTCMCVFTLILMLRRHSNGL